MSEETLTSRGEKLSDLRKRAWAEWLPAEIVEIALNDDTEEKDADSAK